MKNRPQQYRQGDVLIERIAKTDIKKPEPRENGRVILAHGEVTGHAHAIAERSVKKSPFRKELAQNAEISVSQIEIEEAMAQLRHEEHSTIPLERGSYQVTRQREYSPAAIRNVAD